MKMLKILDGFVTNSSSCYHVIILAARKGKELKDIFRRIGLSSKWVEEFSKIEREELKKTSDKPYGYPHSPSWKDEVEYEDLLDEYDFYRMAFDTSPSDGFFHERDCKAYWVLADGTGMIYQRHPFNEDLVVLVRDNTM